MSAVFLYTVRKACNTTHGELVFAVRALFSWSGLIDFIKEIIDSVPITEIGIKVALINYGPKFADVLIPLGQYRNATALKRAIDDLPDATRSDDFDAYRFEPPSLAFSVARSTVFGGSMSPGIHR